LTQQFPPPQSPDSHPDPRFAQPQQPVPPAAPSSAASSNVLSIISFPLAAIALLFIPILFGGAAIVLAAIGKFSRHEKLGTVAFVIAIVATVLGMVLGAIAGANAALNAA
jgi:hypothetical protein